MDEVQKKILSRLQTLCAKQECCTKDLLSKAQKALAAREGYIRPEDQQRLIAFRNNPSDESWIAQGGAQ